MNRRRLVWRLAALLVILGSISGWLVVRVVQQEDKNRALLAAVKRNDTHAAALLLAQGANANTWDQPDTPALHWFDIFLRRLHGGQIFQSERGTSVLTVAATRGNISLVRLLLDKGADLNAKGSDGWTPLIHAVYNGHQDIVKLLLDRGADVTVKDGGTALLWAANMNQKAIAEMLKQAGAKQ